MMQKCDCKDKISAIKELLAEIDIDKDALLFSVSKTELKEQAIKQMLNTPLNGIAGEIADILYTLEKIGAVIYEVHND